MCLYEFSQVLLIAIEQVQSLDHAQVFNGASCFIHLRTLDLVYSPGYEELRQLQLPLSWMELVISSISASPLTTVYLNGTCLHDELKVLEACKHSRAKLTTIATALLPRLESDLVWMGGLITSHVTLTNLKISYGLLRQSTISLFRQLVCLTELTLSQDWRNVSGTANEPLWLEEAPATGLVLPALRALSIDALPTYIAGLPLSAPGVKVLELRGYVLDVEEELPVEINPGWPELDEQAYCSAIETLTKACPKADEI